jgi:DNA-binding MarR family transcriptional regulator
VAANGGTVTVDFAVEIQRANAGITEVVKHLKGFEKQLESLNKTSQQRIKQVEDRFGGLEKVAKRAAQAFSVAVVTNFVKEAANAAIELGRTADKLGTTTEAMSAFQLVGKEAGVSLQQTNKLLLEAQKRLGETAAGTGEAGKFLKKLGLDVSELQRLAPDELFATYADALAKVGEKSEQLAVSEKLMGESAIEAFAIIQGGREALDEARRFTERFSLALDRVDTKQLEQARVAMDRLGAISTSAAQRFALGLAPFIEAFSRTIQETTGSTEGLTAAGSILGATLVTAFELSANAVRVLQAGLLGLAGLTNNALAYVNELIIRGGAALTAFSNPTLLFNPAFQADVNKAVEATTGLLRASADENFRQAEEALKKIKSIQQIQEGIVAILESSRDKAERAVSNQAAVVPGNLTLQDPIGLTLEQQFEINNELARESAAEQASIARELTSDIEAELKKRIDAEHKAAAIIYERVLEGEAAIRQAKAQTADLAIGLLQALGAKNKAFAIAAIVLEKAIAIQRLLVQNRIAAELAFASQLIPGVPTSLATATAAKAAVLAQGYISAGLIAATGALQIADVTSGGGRSPVGTALNPAFVATSPGSAGQPGATSQRTLQLVFNGPVFNSEQTKRYIVEAIREAVDESDVIIIGPGSRQAQELVGG